MITMRESQQNNRSTGRPWRSVAVGVAAGTAVAGLALAGSALAGGTIAGGTAAADRDWPMMAGRGPVVGQMMGAPRTGPCRVLFADWFNTDRGAWRFSNREGSITGGALSIDGDYTTPDYQRRDGWAMARVDAPWRNYTFSATYDSTNATGSPEEVHMATFYTRVQGDGPSDGATYYRIDVWDPGPDPRTGSSEVPNGLVDVARWRDGETTSLVQREWSNTVNGDNAVAITMTGPRITVRLNGKRVLSVVDPDPIRHGGVGVGQIWETDGTFDNVLVTAPRW